MLSPQFASQAHYFYTDVDLAPLLPPMPPKRGCSLVQRLPGIYFLKNWMLSLVTPVQVIHERNKLGQGQSRYHASRYSYLQYVVVFLQFVFDGLKPFSQINRKSSPSRRCFLSFERTIPSSEVNNSTAVTLMIRLLRLVSQTFGFNYFKSYNF